MSQDPFFNLALIPKSAELSALCIELARTNCAEYADAYLLGDSALPHVTLCQFNAPAEKLSDIWRLCVDLSSSTVSLSFRNMYVQYGKGDLSGKSWMGLAVKYEPAILELQSKVFGKLASIGVEGRNLPANYFPHLTFARCDASKPAVISAAPSDDFWTTRFDFDIAIGESDEHGRYHQTAIR